MKTDLNVRKIQTSIGGLIIAIVDLGLKVFRSERKAYRFTGLVLSKMLQPCPVVSHQAGRSSRIHR